MESLYAAFVAKGIKVQPLAGFHGRVPTAQEAQNLRNWALRFGPGGTFWQGRSDGHLAVTHIEFGNETSYSYQYGESGSWWTLVLVHDARANLRAAGQGSLPRPPRNGRRVARAGRGRRIRSSSWVDNMVAAVPDLSRYVAGWTVHPYGPAGFAKIDRMLSHSTGEGLALDDPLLHHRMGCLNRQWAHTLPELRVPDEHDLRRRCGDAAGYPSRAGGALTGRGWRR